MRARALLVLLAVFAMWACDTSTTPDATGSVDCLTVFPGLRVETACGASLRVVINGREVPPTPRRLDVDGAVILPWPDWAAEGAPSMAEAAGFTASFLAHPYQCEVVALDCGSSIDQ